jgi:Arc/MetJ-type ribon-helix-helix transcriptional regulator
MQITHYYLGNWWLLLKPRKRKAVTIDKKLLEWVEEQVEEGKFKNFNQAVDLALERLRGSEKE